RRRPGPYSTEAAREAMLQRVDKRGVKGVEFGKPGTPMVGGVARVGLGVRLAVEDEGPPLPEAMRARLFDSMVSVRNERGGDQPHLGLGLYIVRLIAEFHRGSATAENRPDDRGVIVAVTLPEA